MIYRYRNAEGHVHEHTQSMRDPVPETMIVDGVIYERVWENPHVAVSMGRDAKDAVKWKPGGPPEAFPLGKDGREKWRESTVHGHKVRDYGDGTYSSLHSGIPWIHNEKSRKQRKEQFGAKEPGE